MKLVVKEFEGEVQPAVEFDVLGPDQVMRCTAIELADLVLQWRAYRRALLDLRAACRSKAPLDRAALLKLSFEAGEAED